MTNINRLMRCCFQPLRHYVPPPLYFVLQNTGAPCGVCRQVMREFCRDDFLIHMGGAGGAVQTCTLAELLPYGFSAQRHMQ